MPQISDFKTFIHQIHHTMEDFKKFTGKVVNIGLVVIGSISAVLAPICRFDKTFFLKKRTITAKHDFSTEEIHNWLFGSQEKLPFLKGILKTYHSFFVTLPPSMLSSKQGGVRMQDKYAPKTSFSKLKMISEDGKYTSRMGIYNGSVTDIKADPGQKAAIGDSNNGDLLTGCGYAVATAVINAAGANLQRDLYNQYGVPKIMEVPKAAKEYTKKAYGGTEGRGYSITCDAHDMKTTHHIDRIEFMTVPMSDEAGVRNMYKEAFEHSKDLDYIVLPMAGMSHPVLCGKPKLSATIATEEFRNFVDRHPHSHLKVVYTIFQNAEYEEIYITAAKDLDSVQHPSIISTS